MQATTCNASQLQAYPSTFVTDAICIPTATGFIGDLNNDVSASSPQYTHVAGSVQFSSSYSGSFFSSNPQLAWVSETLFIYNFGGPSSINLPRLTFVGTPLIALTSTSVMVIGYMTALTTILLQALTWVGGTVNIYDNNVLKYISLPLLSSIGGSPEFAPSAYLEFSWNPDLTTIILPALTSVNGAINFYSNNALTLIALPKLAIVGSQFQICSNAASFNIPSNLPALWSPTSMCLVSNGSSTCSISGFSPCP